MVRYYRFKWQNDFSKVRNFSVSKCKGDWIFIIDADEYIKEEDKKRLREFVKVCHDSKQLVVLDVKQVNSTESFD
ncbi:glycosyltransferase [Bacillus salitolerans]|uniref:Glycosyltransferase n=1 Tax=Bacillus salitolerans TaxID=1437434 RepID=A0ABW4LNJ4_9BACI